MCGAHAGKGFDYHCESQGPGTLSCLSALRCARLILSPAPPPPPADHGDPFGPQCFYSAANYSSRSSHPPLIGYGLDGVPIFGRYLYPDSPGFALDLDQCGGHVHTGIGDPYIPEGSYHYRARPFSRRAARAPAATCASA